MDALNILITRSGDYGKWISLNFDFDNWGNKVSPESQTNDPYFLLSEEYQADRPHGEIEFSLYRPPVTATTTAEPAAAVAIPNPLETPPEPAPAVATPEPLEPPPLVPAPPAPEPIEAPCTVADAPINVKIMAGVEESDTLSLAPQPQPIDAPSVATATRSTSTLVGVSEIINTLDLTAMKQPTDAADEQIDEVAVTPSASVSVATPEPVEPAQPVPIASAATASTPTLPLFALNYPPSLPKKLCAQLAEHLKEIPRQEDAQRLLTYFASCLQNGGIRKPLGYFISLKKRVLAGPFDFHEEQGGVDPLEKKKKDTERARIEQRADYSDAVTDYNHLKRSIEATMKSAECTLATALESMSYAAIWEKACHRLETLKKVLNIEGKADNLRVI